MGISSFKVGVETEKIDPVTEERELALVSEGVMVDDIEYFRDFVGD